VLLTLGGLTLLALTLLPPSTHFRQPTASAIVFADQPVQDDRQLLLQAASEQRRAVIAARVPAPPPSVQDIISRAFSPLGDAAVGWALQIAFCESTDNTNAVNSDSNAQGLFQFLPSTWAGTPYAGQSPFDPVANASAAAWLLQTYGPSQWECQA